MQETRLKSIALFVMETLILQYSNKIDEVFVYLFNKFIIQCYEENNELLPVLYDDMDLLKEFIEEEYPLLTYDQMCELLERYGGFNGYVKLLDTIGYEKDLKINQLAILFVAYQNEYWSELEKLYTADPNEFYPKGFPRILQ